MDINLIRDNKDLVITNEKNRFNNTDKIDILHIAGPNSSKLLSEIDSRINDVKFMKMKHLPEFGSSGINLNLFKVSFTGCQGYELHVTRDKSIQLYQLIKNHQFSKEINLSLFGSLALNSLRIEKGFKTYVDLDYQHYLDAGIKPFICKHKKKGIKQYDNISQGKISSIFYIHTDKQWEWSVVGDTPILFEDKVIGYITSSAKGGITNKTIGLGYIDKNMKNNKNCYVNCFGNNWKIDILDEPPIKLG